MSMTEQRPLGELFSELAHNTGTLVRKEVELAAVEMTAKAKKAGQNAAVVAGGGAVVMLGAMGLMAALVLVLAIVVPLWAAALIVGVLVTATGGALVASGIRAIKGIEVAPRETIQTLEENRQWLRKQASR